MIKKDRFFSPPVIFVVYMLISALVIITFRFIFPGEPAPLGRFSFSWRLILGFLDFLRYFPGLALTALVIPFGLRLYAQEKFNPYSSQFLKSLVMPIVTAIIAAAVYGLLFSLVLPLAQDSKTNIRYRSEIYTLALQRAEEHAAAGEWNEAARFVLICERIWPNNPAIAGLRTEVHIQSEGLRFLPEPDRAAVRRAVYGTPQMHHLPGTARPPNATEALALAETALAQERFFDAHWLATLAESLAREGSPEVIMARRLASQAWEGVNSLEPNAAQTMAHRIFRLKRDGYNALLGGEWIRAYYIFLELMQIIPEDPDVPRFFALSETGVKQVAFFIDELEMNLGRTLTNAIFSLPSGPPLSPGRLVMRLASLSTFPDVAYGMGAEILAFDQTGRPLWSIQAPYLKIYPLTLESGYAVRILMRAIDRQDPSRQWEPQILGYTYGVPGAPEIVLPLSWNDFLLLAQMRRGISALPMPYLRQGAENLGAFGYQRQVFEAEILRRFVEPLLLLPLGILAIVAGWRYRALKRPRYMLVPMLGILPVFFSAIEHFIRHWVNNLGILTVVSLGLTTAAILFGIGLLAFLACSLIILASQHD